MATYVQQQIDKKNRRVYFHKGRWIVHICYWLFVLSIESLQEQTLTWKFFFESFFLGNLLIAAFYYIYCLYLIPYFFKRNRMKTYWLLLFGSLLVMPALNIGFLGSLGLDAPPRTGHTSFWYEYGNTIGVFLFNFILFSILLFFMEMSERSSTVRELEEERRGIQETELDLLKTQINPEFMMQALNRLEEMTETNPDDVPAAVISFSDLLRYRLYRAKNRMVPLAEELQALHAFISFEAKGGNNSIQVEVQGNTAEHYIAPLTLLNLAEPWFHDQPEDEGPMLFILLVEAQELTAELHYDGLMPAGTEQQLENYRQQLALLYSNKATFDLHKTDQNTIVSICLPLISNMYNVS